MAKENVGYDDVDAVDEVGELERVDGVSVTLDPAEHQTYAWVTEKEIGEVKFAIISVEKVIMLEVLALRKADMGEVEGHDCGCYERIALRDRLIRRAPRP